MTAYHPPPQWPTEPVRRPSAGLAITSLVLGIIGIVLSFMPILNNVTAAAAIVGLVLGGIGIFKSRPWMSAIGTVLCGAAIMLTLVAQKQLSDELSSIPSPHAGDRVAEAATPEPVADDPAPLDLDDFIPHLKVTDKQCFGDVGCNVTVEPSLEYVHSADTLEDRTYSVTITITGDESGPVITTIDGTGLSYNVMPVMLMTTGTGVAPKAKITDVQEG